MSSDPALAILATRIRIALMRHAHQSVNPANMLENTAYAQEVMALCRASSESSLADLADQFEALLRKLGRALPTAGTPGPGSSRFDTDPAPTPGAEAPAPPAAPHDPHDPRGRRYLRGAR